MSFQNGPFSHDYSWRYHVSELLLGSQRLGDCCKSHHTLPFSMGDASSNGCFSLVDVYFRVSTMISFLEWLIFSTPIQTKVFREKTHFKKEVDKKTSRV